MIACFFIRPKWEGGEYEGDDGSRLEALRLAMQLGADYIDVELKVSFTYIVLYLYCIYM